MYPYPVGVFPYTCISKAHVELRSIMRLLWEQHVTWTRLTILSLVFQLPDTEFVVARLLQNATDMGNSLKPYYGDAIGDKYGDLIREHLVIAADLVKAAKSGDQKAAEAIERKWYANADEIAQFLNYINPYLPLNEVRKMLYEHLALTKSEAVFMLKKDYQSGVAVFDIIEAQALHMADEITDAIVKQFPYLS
ncbi:hypothetical protein [Shimazuella kribbensis]|uniref:hypothetical protein n=1 Tax=Shimazuella kribbensis TaxID=139808 RepID=UPI00048AFE00|nr:hypothetical protein [Shimazuella kribbensis]